MTNRLTITELIVAYDERRVIEQLTLGIKPGRLTAIVGPNGCGKSTLLRAMARVLRPVSGHVLLDEDDVWALSPRQVAQRLALLPQSAHAPSGISVYDLVARGRHPHQRLFQQWSGTDEAAVESALEVTEITDLAERLVHELSGGQRQRVWIAMVLAQQTETILLDEPTTFLDIAHQYSLMRLMRQLVDRDGRTVVAVLHDLQQAARYADELIVLHDGHLKAQGSPQDVLTADLVGEVFGLKVHLVVDEVTGTSVVIPTE